MAETRGNPLAILELSQKFTVAELAGGFAAPDSGPLAKRLEENFGRRLQTLPPDTNRLLLVAAAEPVGDATLLWRAAERMGITAEAAAPARSVGLLEVGARVRFGHPLMRSAVYGAGSVSDRQEVHRALADSIDGEVDPDRQAWHLALAAPGHDENVALELERSAHRAEARGGVAAAAAFLERSAELTRDPTRRSQRMLDAAQAMLRAGAFEQAARLVAIAEAGPLDELSRARIDLLHAEIAFIRNRGRDAVPLLLARHAGSSSSTSCSPETPTWMLSRRRSSPAVWRAAQGCERWASGATGGEGASSRGWPTRYWMPLPCVSRTGTRRQPR